MTAGVIRAEPSHDTPPNAEENVDAETVAVYLPEPTSSNVNEPSSPVVDDSVFPSEPFSTTFAPGMPSSSGSTLPALPPPGLKSRQTTPVISELLARGTFACFAFAGRSSGGMPVSPISADRPAWIGVLSVKPLDFEPVTVAEDGCASSIGPDETKSVRTLPIAAFTAPWLGSLRYMTCQMTPVAKSEIAIGMKRIVLKATDQRTRSVRTAKSSPKIVMISGTIASHTNVRTIESRTSVFVHSCL